jgi:hypothetical protein
VGSHKKIKKGGNAMSKSYSSFKALHKYFEEQGGEPADITMRFSDGRTITSRERCGPFFECYGTCHKFGFELVTYQSCKKSDFEFIWTKNQYDPNEAA